VCTHRKHDPQPRDQNQRIGKSKLSVRRLLGGVSGGQRVNQIQVRPRVRHLEKIAILIGQYLFAGTTNNFVLKSWDEYRAWPGQDGRELGCNAQSKL
jgi:hypothetical protein